MTSTLCRITALLLALCLLLPLSGCYAKDGDIKKEGIEIADREPISSAATEYALGVITELLKSGYLTLSGMQALNDAKAAELEALAERILPLTVSDSVCEAQYKRIFDTLARDGEGVILELAEARSGEGEGLRLTQALYNSLSAEVGAEYVGSLLYKLSHLYYEVHIEKLEARYESFGYAYLLEDIEQARADKLTLAEGIGEAAFASAVRCLAALAELVGGEAALVNFTDGEALTLIKNIELSELEGITEDGWLVMLSLYDPKAQDISYRAELARAMRDGGELERIAAAMTDAVTLARAMQRELKSEDIAAIRAGDGAGVLTALTERLTEEERLLFFELDRARLDSEELKSIAEEHYGEEYTEFLGGIEPVSCEQMLSSVGTDEFESNLINYLLGAYPPIAWEVLK